MTTSTMNKSRAAATTLGELSALAIPHEPLEAQKLHGATFAAEDIPQGDPGPSDPSPVTPAADGDKLREGKIADLLDQISEGLQADDATNFEKLTIARNLGQLLLDLKKIVPHGEFKKTLKERFPKVSYYKCNRCMTIAENEAEVAAAIEKYPDVAWGPKKMIDYLKGWNPEEEPEDDEDEDDSDGFPLKDHLKEEPLLPLHDDVEDAPEPDATSPFAVGALNPDFAAEVEEHQQEVEEEKDAMPTAGPATHGGRTPPRNKPTIPRTRPTVNRTEYAVEVSLSFKLSVPVNVTAEQVAAAFRDANGVRFEANTPFDYELSDMTLVELEVRPTDGLAVVTQP